MIEPNDWRPIGRLHPSLPGLVMAATSLFASGVLADTSPPPVRLTMRLAVANNNGQVGCLLFGSAKGFPKDPTAALQRKWCAIASLESVCSFDPIPRGTYAVACFHDENRNGKLDTGLFGIPIEGTVASRNARRLMGPPSFDDARIAFSGNATELKLRMNY